jgi:hypothetical protein
LARAGDEVMPSTQTLYRASMLPSNDIGNVSAETQWPDGRGKLLILPLASNNSLANKSFRIRTYGRCATTTNTTFAINFYFGLSPVLANNTLIFLSGAQVVNALSSNFLIWVDLTWDSTSQVINGTGQGQIANNIVGPSTLQNTVAADPNRDSNTFLQSGATYGFTLTGQFGGASAGNHAFMDDFSLELI